MVELTAEPMAFLMAAPMAVLMAAPMAVLMVEWKDILTPFLLVHSMCTFDVGAFIAVMT